MEIMQLLKRVETYKIIGDEKAIVEGLSFTDTGICKNYVYFCIKGTKVDGLDYVENAVKNGASVVVSEQEIETTATLVVVQNAITPVTDVAVVAERCSFIRFSASR